MREVFLEPFYEYIDEHLDDQQAILYFLRRYKHRCEWFHADRLRQAVRDDTQRGEKTLALDLYEYLHDQGIDFHIEPHSTSGIPDFVADQVGKERVIADTKLFWPESSKGKSYIISGFNQAYIYACDYNEPCAYLVIYKMCHEGLNFLVPSTQSSFPSLTVNNKTIFFVVVDIFEYETSASKRGPMKSVDITEKELVQSVETGEALLGGQSAVRESLDAVYLRVAGANNSIVGDAKVFLARPWNRRRLTMGPYSMDLRERVAAVIDEGEGSQRQVAKRFRVSVSFVTRLLQRRRDAGTLAPKPHGGGPRPVLGFPEQVRLAMLIAEHPDAILNQLKEWGGFACTLTTIWRTLRRFRLTYKKKTLHASERDDPEVQAKRRRYRRKVKQIDAKRLVFVDETGINTAMTPSHAWARRGERAIGSVPTSWGSTTVIAALGLDGVRAPLVFPGATDTQAFQTYVDEVLVPELRPGDVVIFDNLKPHLAPHVAESIERAGASVLPLPPYSSDYDPIEELWSKFKGELRRVAARVRNDLYNAVGEILDHVTLQDILGWFNHSGVYATHA